MGKKKIKSKPSTVDISPIQSDNTKSNNSNEYDSSEPYDNTYANDGWGLDYHKFANWNYEHRRVCCFRCRTERDHFEKWYNTYEPYIEELYDLLISSFNISQRQKEFKINASNEYKEFVLFVYNSSSKYISPYL